MSISPSMRLYRLFTTLWLFSQSLAKPHPAVCDRIAAELLSYPPAQSYCASKYPVSKATKTVTAPAVTFTEAVATTVSIYTSTTTSTTFIYFTSLVTQTVTLDKAAGSISSISGTTTSAGKRNLDRRQVSTTSKTPSAMPSSTLSRPQSTTTLEPSPASHTTSIVLNPAIPQASKFSSLLSNANGVIAAVCTCIGGRCATTTVTITPTTTQKVTATITSTSTETLIRLRTWTVFATTTITVTAATSATPPTATTTTVRPAVKY